MHNKQKIILGEQKRSESNLNGWLEIRRIFMWREIIKCTFIGKCSLFEVQNSEGFDTKQSPVFSFSGEMIPMHVTGNAKKSYFEKLFKWKCSKATTCYFLKLFKCVKKWRRNSTTTNFWLPFNVRTLDRQFKDCNNLCKDNFHLKDQFYYESLLVITNKLSYILILIYSYIDIFLKP